MHSFRLLVEALAMTGSDLCASSKPWDLQMQTVTTIYEEFYSQGDTELESGRVPLPIMNREFIDQQAFHQVTWWASVAERSCMVVTQPLTACLFFNTYTTLLHLMYQNTYNSVWTCYMGVWCFLLGWCWKRVRLETHSFIWQRSCWRGGFDAGKSFLNFKTGKVTWNISW